MGLDRIQENIIVLSNNLLPEPSRFIFVKIIVLPLNLPGTHTNILYPPPRYAIFLLPPELLLLIFAHSAW